MEEALNLSVNLMSISARAANVILSNILGVFRSCHDVVEVIQPLVCRRSYGLLVPWLPVIQGIRSYWRDCIATVSDVPGSLLPAVWFIRSLMEKVLTFYLTL